MNKLENGFYWVNDGDGDIIVEYDNAVWYFFGAEYEYKYMPVEYEILGKVAAFNGSK